MRLKEQVAIITGAGQGIGKAIAFTLGREGAAIVVNDIKLELAKKVADEITVQGGKAQSIKADISNAKEVNKLVEMTLDYYKKIDILVNNAGVQKLMPALELPEEEWDRTIDINLKGQFLCSQAVAKYMIEQKRGKIINIASIGAHISTPGIAAYCASKGGVIQLTRALATEWGPYNINVNAVSPGLTMTALVEDSWKRNPDFVGGIDRIPLQRLAKPEDIANVVLFLASEESDYISGEEIIVDGGTLTVHPRIVSKKVG
jgi:NAD(P)-dependent dehydrogenase (short-subunit alcohol dehydrogenase family)